jgi:cytochrome c553
MRDAVARGALEEAKGEARLLAELRVEGPPGPTWKQLFDGMTAAAATMASANDLNDAARDVGTLAKACGECHTRFGRPGVIVGQVDARAGGVRAFMQRHQWAAERLWDGLVVPSDEAWQAGALSLSEAPLAPEQLTPGRSPVPKVGDMEQTVHALARAARNAERAEVRASLYGQVLATCAACHAWLGGGPASELP